MMSEEYRQIEDRIRRMARRKESVIKVITELQVIAAEADTDMQSMQLQLDALRYEGDDGTK